MGLDRASDTGEAKGVAAAATVVFFGVTLALYGGWLLYGELTTSPYTFVAEEVDAEDVDGQSRSVVEFDELPEDERAAFLEMVEGGGAGEGYDSVSDSSPIDADVVAYEGAYYEVRLGEVREVGGPISYVFAAVLGVGLAVAIAGVRLLQRKRA